MKTKQNLKAIDNLKHNDLVLIQSLSHDGRGITTVNQKKTFVFGALPNEEVRINITKKRSSYNEAHVLEIKTPSPTRVSPPCGHFEICGGCSLQHMTMETQLQLKQQTLLNQLQHFGNAIPEEVIPPLHVNDLGYRRKARLGAKFVTKKNKLLIGFRERKSAYLADINHCPVLHPSVGLSLEKLSELVSSLSVKFHIPQIEVAIGDVDKALIIRHLEALSESDQEKIKSFAIEHHFHIYLQPNSPNPITKLWPLDGKERLHYSLPELDLNFEFYPTDFTQINLEMNRAMVSQALRLLDLQPHETVLDLFCGIGNFTLPMARLALHVTGIEGSMEMVNRANENATLNHMTNVNFQMANLDEPPLNSDWMQKHYDKILLDPPRIGALAMVNNISLFRAKRIVYVSCNPATLARDAGVLTENGYVLKQTGIMNMFPHTSHIEAMAVFDKT